MPFYAILVTDIVDTDVCNYGWAKTAEGSYKNF